MEVVGVGRDLRAPLIPPPATGTPSTAQARVQEPRRSCRSSFHTSVLVVPLCRFTSGAAPAWAERGEAPGLGLLQPLHTPSSSFEAATLSRSANEALVPPAPARVLPEVWDFVVQRGKHLYPPRLFLLFVLILTFPVTESGSSNHLNFNTQSLQLKKETTCF